MDQKKINEKNASDLGKQRDTFFILLYVPTPYSHYRFTNNEIAFTGNSFLRNSNPVLSRAVESGRVSSLSPSLPLFPPPSLLLPITIGCTPNQPPPPTFDFAALYSAAVRRDEAQVHRLRIHTRIHVRSAKRVDLQFATEATKTEPPCL